MARAARPGPFDRAPISNRSRGEMSSAEDDDLYYYVDLKVRAFPAPPRVGARSSRSVAADGGSKNTHLLPTRVFASSPSSVPPFFTLARSPSLSPHAPTADLPAPSAPQGDVQGPYPWSNLDEWLINKYIGADLQVSKAGTSTWMPPSGDLLARRRRGEGKPTGSAPRRAPRSRARSPPPPAAAPPRGRALPPPPLLETALVPVPRISRRSHRAHAARGQARAPRRVHQARRAPRGRVRGPDPRHGRVGLAREPPRGVGLPGAGSLPTVPRRPRISAARGGDAKKRRRGESFGPGSPPPPPTKSAARARWWRPKISARGDTRSSPCSSRRSP